MARYSLPFEVTFGYPEGAGSTRSILDLLHSIDRRLTIMSDALAGIQTDEQTIAQDVPQILSDVTAQASQITQLSQQIATLTAAGTPVDPTELASIQTGLDGVAQQLQAAVAAQAPATASTGTPADAAGGQPGDTPTA